MTNILNIATSGLATFQHAITVTGNNISNVNTDGYSRQFVALSSRPTVRVGDNFLGSGVQLDAVKRLADRFIDLQLRNSYTTNSELNAYVSQAQRLDELLADSSSSIAPGIQEFFAALQNVVENPDYTPVRETLLSQADILKSRLNSFAGVFADQNSQLNNAFTETVTQINSIASSLASINGELVGGTSSPPELLDKRGVLLNDLAKLVAVNVTEQADGAVNVTIGNGQSLVVAGTAIPLSTGPNSGDPEILDISLALNGNTIAIDNSNLGGTLGGLISFRDEILTPVRNDLGRIGIGLAATFNAQHRLGMDLNDSLGGDFFTDVNGAQLQQARSISNVNNTGTAVLGASIADAGQLTTSDYRLTVTAGPNYSLTRLSDNTVTAFAALPQTVDGFTINLVSGAVAVGDTFLIAPTRHGARDFGVNVTTTSAIAAAAPIRTSSATTNTGTGAISAGVAVDTTNAAFTTTPGQLTPPVRVEFLSPTSYQLVNVTTSGVIEGPIVYNPAISNAIFPTPGAYDPGYRVDISGAPSTGDSFTIDYNSGGSGDNRNGLLLTNLQQAKTLKNGTASFQDGYAELVANVGSKTYNAAVNRDTSASLLNQAIDRRETLSGVNLDEEAANLLRFEQAYQAMAQVISTAGRLFDSIIANIG